MPQLSGRSCAHILAHFLWGLVPEPKQSPFNSISSRSERVEESGAEMAVVVEVPNGEALARAVIPGPTRSGVTQLLLSANERYLAMYRYSGLSEEGSAPSVTCLARGIDGRPTQDSASWTRK